MRRALFLFAACLAAWARADESWYSVLLKQQRAGYVMYASAPEGEGTLSTSLSVIGGKMLGSGIEIRVATKTWSDKAGRITRMEFDLSSGGKSHAVTAQVEGQTIKAKSTMDGRSTERTLVLPKDGRLADDTLTSYLDGGAPTVVYVFDPNSLALVKCEPKVKGKEKVETPLGTVEATVIDAGDPRAPTLLYLSSKGDLIKSVGPFGLEIVPSTKEEALSERGTVDIADASSIRPDREIEDFLNVHELELEITGTDLSRIPSDAHQTVTRKGDGWSVMVHPVEATSGGTAAADAAWLAPDLRIPSDKEKFIRLAKEKAADAKGAVARAERIRRFVQETVKANPGIGVWRDADDVLASGDGVCRDHAVLLGTLLRADGIPTRFCGGLVYAMGAFYYHAWVEFWDGTGWVGADSTRPTQTIDATHIKLSCGNVSDAFTSFLIDGAKITVKKG
ncbi:MAG: transglutaminase domain-containing protein [Armatimonadetes bacterium]|nr:transglutaminase domain-containing protein [Armatimonadota bacterium]